MKSKRFIVFFICLFVIIATVVAIWYILPSKEQAHDEVMTDERPTLDAVCVKEVPHADSLIVGQWQNKDNPQWYKVYYDDYDEGTGKFWGKEWNEAEDVLEEDLKYHGNGWFRWEIKNKKLHEYSTMNTRDVPIHREYKIRLSTSDSLVVFEPDYKHIIIRFGKMVK